jgi:A/G-specific adenine glycosylase
VDLKAHSTFAEKLTRWFQSAQRDLPWREEINARDPYRVVVSEVMLQQTTVAAVIPFYRRFLERFPDIQTLAAAELDEVLPLWAGLGYYSRARNLHACARAVMEKHGGQFPTTFDEVLALPGIGRYTAGAVLSIALDQHVAIVDANVARVLARVLCLEDDVKGSENQAKLWSEAAQLVEAAKIPSQFNPAMMELGALICVPKTPRCEVCPVQQFCCAFQTQRQNELPHATPKRAEIEMHDVCAFVLREGRVLLRRRSDEAGDKNWWRGMWELPRTTLQQGERTHDALRRLFQNEISEQIEVGEKLKSVSHGVTHHRIALDCLQVELENDSLQEYSAREEWRFFAWEETRELALPSVMRRLLDWLQSHAALNKQLRLL